MKLNWLKKSKLNRKKRKEKWLIANTHILIKGKKTIIRFISFFVIIGVVISIAKQNKYKASSIFIPQNKTSETPVFFNETSHEIRNNKETQLPLSLYIQVLNSINVYRDILAIEFDDEEPNISYKNYLIKESNSPVNNSKKNTIGLPSNILGYLSKDVGFFDFTYNPMVVSLKEQKLFNIIRNRMKLKLNKSNGAFEFSFIDKDPEKSSILNVKTLSILEEHISAYNMKYDKEYYRHINKEYAQKKMEYIKLLDRTSILKDKKRLINSEQSLTELKQNEVELRIKYNIYRDLAIKREQASLKMAKNKTNFITIKPALNPSRLFVSNNSIFIFMCGLIGFIFSLFYLYLISNNN